MYKLRALQMLLLGVFFTVFISSCKTDDASLDTENSINAVDYKELTFTDLQKAVEVAIDYAEKLKELRISGNIGRENLSDETVGNGKWILESVNNYNFRAFPESLEKFEKYELEFEVPKQPSGLIRGQDLADVYNESIYLRTQLLLGEDKQLVITDVEIKEETAFNVVFSVVILTGLPTSFDAICNLQENDYWSPGNADGLCHPTLPNNYLGVKDAADREEELINNSCMAPYCELGTHAVNWLEVETRFYNYNDSTLGDLKFNGDDCQSPIEIQHNLNILDDIINMNHPGGNFVMQFIRVEDELGFFSDGPFYIHRGRIVYAVAYCITCCD